MTNIFLVILSFGLGILFKKMSEVGDVSKEKILFPADTPKALNAFILYVSLPSLVLLHIHELNFQWSLVALVFMPWILFIFSFILCNFLGKIFHWEKSIIGSLILTSGLGNTSFVGLPMIEAYYGKEYLSLGLIADQGGTFLVLSTLGILVANHYSPNNYKNNQKISFLEILKKVFFFPPFFALVITLILRNFSYPLWFKEILKTLGSTLTPLALFSVGFQLKLQEIKGLEKFLIFGLFNKLILLPVFIAFLYKFFQLSDTVYHISIFEAAMAPMITGGIVAISYNLKPSLVILMLAIGIPLSFFTLPVFWYFFH